MQEDCREAAKVSNPRSEPGMRNLITAGYHSIIEGTGMNLAQLPAKRRIKKGIQEHEDRNGKSG